MWQSWPERQLATNSLGRMRISKAPLIYNTDRNMKSSRVPDPELIKSAMGEEGAKTVFAYKLEALWEQSIRIPIAQGEPGLHIKISKESTSRTRKDS